MHQSQHLIATSPLITINTIQSLILSNTSPQHSIESFIFTFTVSYTIFIFIFYKNIYFPHYSVMVNQTTKMFFSECQPWSTSMVLIYWDQMHTIHLNRYSDISFNNRGFGGGPILKVRHWGRCQGCRNDADGPWSKCITKKLTE